MKELKTPTICVRMVHDEVFLATYRFNRKSIRYLKSADAILLRDWLIEAFPLPPGEVEINYDKLLPKQEVVDGRRIVRKLPPRSFEDVFPPRVVPPSPPPAMEERNPSGGSERGGEQS